MKLDDIGWNRRTKKKRSEKGKDVYENGENGWNKHFLTFASFKIICSQNIFTQKHSASFWAFWVYHGHDNSHLFTGRPNEPEKVLQRKPNDADCLSHRKQGVVLWKWWWWWWSRLCHCWISSKTTKMMSKVVKRETAGIGDEKDFPSSW